MVRLVAADIFTDICRFPEELEVGLPQRLQTSMSLYSNNLSGLVLLTDDAYMSLEGSKMTNDFNKLCNQSTEFHFPSFEQQLESIRNEHLEASTSYPAAILILAMVIPAKRTLFLQCRH